MAVPSFGPSQRVEISRYYLSLNESNERQDGYRLYDTINPKENVAEEGQVVLLKNDEVEMHGGLYAHTSVIPDAAGYRVDTDLSSTGARQRDLFLSQELSKFNVGVNQVEKGIKKNHSSSGSGWDISFTPGHQVDIKHTGHEPIWRFDIVGVRFPTDEDMRAQSDVWSSGNRNGHSVSKFATYPIRENIDMVKYQRFVTETETLRDEITRKDTPNSSIQNVRVELMQLPALMKVVNEVFRCHSNEAMMACVTGLQSGDLERETLRDMLVQEEGMEMIMRIARAAVDFCLTLRPPVMLAMCIAFRGAQPHMKRAAECGDIMRCILL